MDFQHRVMVAWLQYIGRIVPVGGGCFSSIAAIEGNEELPVQLL